jgi:membrane-associated phospholipid phosphatase
MTIRRNVLLQLAFAIVLFTGFWWLGLYVSAHPEPPALWSFARAVRGEALALAWAFTTAGWPQVLAPLFACTLAIAIFIRPWRLRASFLLVCGVLAWRAADGLQKFFARPRRLDWLMKHELASSYPSSHATMSTAFYLLAAVLVARSELPAALRYPLAAAFAVVWLGILWSRLALAAHYPTDVIGGVCLGAVIVLLASAVLRLTGARFTA